MSIYKEPYHPLKSLSFDSPNAEMNFHKSFNFKLTNPPSSKPLKTFTTNFSFDSQDKFISSPPRTYEMKNPISQDNQFYQNNSYKPSFKKTPFSNVSTINTEEPYKKVLKPGAFNQNHLGLSGQDTWKPIRK